MYVSGSELHHRLCCEPLTDFVVGGDFLKAQPSRMYSFARLLAALRKVKQNIDSAYEDFEQKYKGTNSTPTLPTYLSR